MLQRRVKHAAWRGVLAGAGLLAVRGVLGMQTAHKLFQRRECLHGWRSGCARQTEALQAGPCVRRMKSSHELLERRERFGCQRRWRVSEEAPFAYGVNQTCSTEDLRVIRDRGLRETQHFVELRARDITARDSRLEDPQPRGVPESLKDGHEMLVARQVHLLTSYHLPTLSVSGAARTCFSVVYSTDSHVCS